MTRTYLVTGSASGIGKATVELLHTQGARVIGADIKDADIVADLSTEQGCTDLVAAAAELSGGQLDGVIAVAGLNIPKPVTALVNYFGAKATLEGLQPLLAKSPAPRAVVVASIASIQPYDETLLDALLANDRTAVLSRCDELATDPRSGYLIYSTSKRAISMWLRNNAPQAEWAGQGIALNAIAPGAVITPMTRDLLGTEEGRKKLNEQVPMPLNGPFEAEVAAKLLVWLASVENSHLCGQVIFIDGGYDAIKRTDSTW